MEEVPRSDATPSKTRRFRRDKPFCVKRLSKGLNLCRPRWTPTSLCRGSLCDVASKITSQLPGFRYLDKRLPWCLVSGVGKRLQQPSRRSGRVWTTRLRPWEHKPPANAFLFRVIWKKGSPAFPLTGRTAILEYNCKPR